MIRPMGPFVLSRFPPLGTKSACVRASPLLFYRYYSSCLLVVSSDTLCIYNFARFQQLLIHLSGFVSVPKASVLS